MYANHPATPAKELLGHQSHEARILTVDAATAPVGPGTAVRINETAPTITLNGLRGWIARRPVVSFLVLLFALVYIGLGAAVGAFADGYNFEGEPA